MVENNTFTKDMKKKIVIDFLKEHNNIGFSIGELTRHLMTDLLYTGSSSAGASMRKMLNILEEDNLVYFKKIKGKRGSQLMKVWFLKDEI